MEISLNYKIPIRGKAVIASAQILGMVRRSKEHKQCILQGKCEACGSMNDNYIVTNHEHKNSSVEYEIKCECGEEVTVRITPDGLSTSGKISYLEASWTSKSERQKKEEAEEAENEETEEGLNRDNNKMQ